MAKKFFDIIPPSNIDTTKDSKVKKAKREPLLREREGGRSQEKIKGQELRGIGQKKSYLGLIFTILAAVILLVGIFGYSSFSKAYLSVWPEKESLSLQDTVTINPGIDQTNFEKKEFLGKVFETEKTVSGEFNATGKTVKEARAKGVIRVYNSYSSASQALLASTRFVSTQGKLFRSIKRGVVPGTKQEGGKTVPGYADIEVQAAESGEDYNIEPTTFSIPGFAGTPKYTAIYGRSFLAMAGGFRGEVGQIVEKDLKDAQNTLFDNMKKESVFSFNEIVPKDFIFLPGTVFYENMNLVSSKKSGEEGESFSLKLTARAKVLAFRKIDIDNFAQNLINSNIASGQKERKESAKISYSPESLDKEIPKIILKVSTETEIYSDINLVELGKVMSGLSFKEAQAFLKDLSGVQRIEIKSFPFWRNKFPQDLNRIEIHLRID